MPNANPYRPIKTEVLDVITETPTINTLRLKPQEPIFFKTGQFIELTVPGVGEAPAQLARDGVLGVGFGDSRGAEDRHGRSQVVHRAEAARELETLFETDRKS